MVAEIVAEWVNVVDETFKMIEEVMDVEITEEKEDSDLADLEVVLHLGILIGHLEVSKMVTEALQVEEIDQDLEIEFHIENGIVKTDILATEEA